MAVACGAGAEEELALREAKLGGELRRNGARSAEATGGTFVAGIEAAGKGAEATAASATDDATAGTGADAKGATLAAGFGDCTSADKTTTFSTKASSRAFASSEDRPALFPR